MSLSPEMPTTNQNPSTVLFALYKRNAKKQRKAQSTLLHYENNAAASNISPNLRVILSPHHWSPEFDIEATNIFNAHEQTNWHTVLLSIQLQRAEFLRKYIAEKQVSLDRYLEDAFIYSELHNLTNHTKTVEELSPAVEEFKTLINTHLKPRPKNPSSLLPPPPQISLDADMTQDDVAPLTTSGSSSSSSGIKASSTKPLKNPNQPNQTSLEKKLETLTAMVLKATKSIATLELKFPDGPQTVGKREPQNPQNNLQKKSPRHQPRSPQTSAAPSRPSVSFPAQNTFYSALPTPAFPHMQPFGTGFHQLQHPPLQQFQPPTYYNPAFNNNNLLPPFYPQPPPPLGLPPYNSNVSATHAIGSHTTSRNPGSRNPRSGTNGKKKEKRV